MTERFAIYFAPAEADLLWHRACSWLGRDSVSGELMPQPVPETMTGARFEDLTESARRYGFHGTLRSPFRLAEGVDHARLLEAMADFAAKAVPVDLGPADVHNLSGFLAIMPIVQSPALTAFAADCVTHFEPCRAPLTESERARRLGSNLTNRQTELVDQYGYPYVMEEFRFHMTLTDRLDDADRMVIEPAARHWFAEALARPLVLDRIVLFHEPEPGAPFFRLEEFVLAGSH